MKYNLIIGYQVFERNKDLPVISVFLDGSLLDQFDCDNEQSIEVSIREEFNVVDEYNCYKRGCSSTRVYKYSSPAKYKIIEVDSSNWTDHGKLTIEVSSNKSNYNNGFMTKRSMVCISPVFLMSKDIDADQSVLQRITKRSQRAKILIPSTIIDNALTWPGITQHPDREDQRYMGQGDNFKLHFDIRKKHRTHVIVKDDTIPKGYFVIDRFATAWLQHHYNNYFDFVTNVINTSIANNDPLVVKHDCKVELREKTKE